MNLLENTANSFKSFQFLNLEGNFEFYRNQLILMVS